MDMSELTTNLRSRLMLARLNISEWGVHRVDRKASDKVADEFYAKSDAGKYYKALLPKAAIQPWITAKNRVRAKFYQLTLPWTDDGYRVLTAEAYLDLVQELAVLESEAMNEIRKLVSNLDSWKAEAQNMLGTLYDDTLYPEPEELEREYAIRLHITPMPSGADFRVDLDDVTVSEIRSDIDKQVNSAVQQAMRDVYDRAYTAIRHMADKLGDEKAIFRDSLVENVAELVDLLPKLNVSGDTRINQLADDVTLLCRHPAQTLRDDLSARAETAKNARKLSDRLKSWI